GYGHSIFGTKGSVIQQHPDNFIRVYAQDNHEKAIAEWEMNDEGTAHMQNFLDCVRSRKPTNSPIETAHQVITACHLTNLAYRQETKEKWDAEKGKIISSYHIGNWYRASGNKRCSSLLPPVSDFQFLFSI